MMPKGGIRSFDRKDESSANYAQEAELWGRAASLDVTKRTSATEIQMDPAARDVCASGEAVS